MPKKAYVFDTNVILSVPNSIFSFKNAEIYIPFTVIEEIDEFKKDMSAVGFSAREFGRKIDEIRNTGNLISGVVLPNGSILKIVNFSQQEFLSYNCLLDLKNNDNKILLTTEIIKEKNPDKEVILISRDINVRIKADILGIKSENYTLDSVNISEIPKGWREISVKNNVVDDVFANKFYPYGEDIEIENIYPNEYFLFKNKDNNQQQAIVRYDKEENGFFPLKNYKSICGIKPKSIEQKIAIDMLIEPKIKLVSLIGRSGSGKTLLSLACGVNEVFEMGTYDKLIVSRPVIPLKNSNDIGYLPGTIEEKMRPWLAPIYDNLEYIFMVSNLSFGKQNFKTVDELMESKIIDIQVITFIRGRSIPNQFVIFDEIQNCSPHEIKTIITRMGENTKIVLCGDIEQIDSPYLSIENNALVYATQRLMNSELTSHLFLERCERSKLADLASKIL